MRLVGFGLCALVQKSVIAKPSFRVGFASVSLSSSSSYHFKHFDMPRRSNRKRSASITQGAPDSDNQEQDKKRPAKQSSVRRQPPPQQEHTDLSTTRATTPDDLCKSIVDNLYHHANQSTRDWFENYVKGTTWIGCKLPTVRTCVQEIVPPIMKKNKSTNETPLFSTSVLLDTAVQLLQQPACDTKLAGMLILSECFPVAELTSHAVLDRLEREVLEANQVNDWSSADWFASKVLRKISLEADPPTDDTTTQGENEMVQRILDYTKQGTNLWYRRCGVVPFVQYYRHRAVLPDNIGSRLVQACEQSLLASPTERFTQTGVAWVLRYMLSRQTATEAERHAAATMILSHPSLWNTEAKKSLTEKLAKNDPLRTQILNLK